MCVLTTILNLLYKVYKSFVIFETRVHTELGYPVVHLDFPQIKTFGISIEFNFSWVKCTQH